jgi:sensor c-di-GMP phosphodiesterase-like protein
LTRDWRGARAVAASVPSRRAAEPHRRILFGQRLCLEVIGMQQSLALWLELVLVLGLVVVLLLLRLVLARAGLPIRLTSFLSRSFLFLCADGNL